MLLKFKKKFYKYLITYMLYSKLRKREDMFEQRKFFCAFKCKLCSQSSSMLFRLGIVVNRGVLISSTIIFIIFWDFLMFCQIFILPQVKRCAIITYKHSIYELPHKLPSDLRLRTSTPWHFRRWGGQGAHTRRKTKDLGS